MSPEFIHKINSRKQLLHSFDARIGCACDWDLLKNTWKMLETMNLNKCPLWQTYNHIYTLVDHFIFWLTHL